MKTNLQSKSGLAYVKPCAVGAFLVGLCLSGISTQAYVIIDNFDLTGDAREAGKTIYGTTTMTGGATWQGDNQGMVFGGTATNGYLTADYAGGGYGGGTAAVPVSFSSGNTIKVQLDLYSIAHGTDFCGTSIGIGTTSSNLGGLYGIVWGPNTGSGLFQVFKNGGAYFDLALATTEYTYNPDGFNTYSIEYNSVMDTCTITANGVSKTASVGGLTSAVNYAGVGYSPWYASSQVDNFSVEVIPEPTTLALLTMGGLALGRRNRRN